MNIPGNVSLDLLRNAEFRTVLGRVLVELPRSVTETAEETVAPPPQDVVVPDPTEPPEGATLFGIARYDRTASLGDEMIVIATPSSTTYMTLTLPLTTARTLPYWIRNLSSARDVRIVPSGSELIDTAAVYNLRDATVMLVPHSGRWWVFKEHA